MNADGTIRNVVKPSEADWLGGDLALEDLDEEGPRGGLMERLNQHGARQNRDLHGGRRQYQESIQLAESEHVQLKSMNILHKLSFDSGE
jgi:hypothetical protein